MKSRGVTFKLVIAFATLISVLMGIGWLGLSRMSLMNDNIHEITDRRWAKVQVAREALHYSTLNSRITMQIFLLDDPQKIDAMLTQRANNTAKISALLKKIEAKSESKTEQALVAAIWTNRNPYVESYQRALSLLLKEGQPAAAREMMATVVTPNLISYHQAWEDFVAFQGGGMDQAATVAEAYYVTARRQVLLLLTLALVLACAVAVFVTRGTSKEIGSRLRAEEGLREAHDVLERRIEQRTEELSTANAEMQKTQKELMETSRQAGMAEVATSVLHNVGNVLNSVNVSASLVGDAVKKSKSASLAKVVALMREHKHDLGTFISTDPKGLQLPTYLNQLSEHLLAEQEMVILELKSLRKNIEHIKEIVAMQQSYTKVSGVKEIINVCDLVEDSLRMNVDALDRHRVEIIREFKNVPSINIDKHKVLQVLVNLIRNAKYACDDGARTDKRLTVSVTDGEGRIKISVTDNGVGISPENLTHIFSHGFTTRKDGHGFGLHSGALAAKEMGGSLTVQSDGVGQGATFRLELPASANGDSHAK